jgi:enamine deaminase RidA (YjgF/YER057c/UK114 family)
MARNASEPAIRLSNPEELAPPPGYSNIVEISGGRIIFIAGQTALDKHGGLVGKGDFEAQADQVFRNISAALASVGCTARNLAKLTVFVRDLGELAAYRRARNRFLRR